MTAGPTGPPAAAGVLADGAPVTTPREPAREAAERELLDPAYHQDDPNIVQRAIDWFWQKATDILDAAATATPGGTFGLAVIAVVVVLVLIALRLRLGRIRQAATPRGAVFGSRPATAAEHRAAAERHAALQQWEEAVQERMRAVVRSLEERAVLDPRPGRTADEAAAEASRVLPGHRAALHAAARSFDDVRYGGIPATEQDYQRMRALDTDLQRSRPALAAADGGGAW